MIWLCLGALWGGLACASEGPRGASSPALLRVGTSGDYAPFSHRASASELPEGFDIAVAQAFARDRGLRLELVPFRWPELLTDLERGRFDVAMSGVTVRPERSAAGRFTLPVARTGAMAIVALGAAGPLEVEALDRAEMRVVVNAGGHLERVARRRLPNARVLAISPNRAVLDALLAGRADAAVTDSLEAPHWLSAAGAGYRALGPFTRDRKAYLVRPERPALARALDSWLLARESDGQLAALRARHLGEPSRSTGAKAEPDSPPVLAALWAALDERLALMPAVAEAKRRENLAVEDRAVEARVLESALRALRKAEELRGAEALRKAEANGELGDPAALGADEVRAFYRELIEAAKEVQRHTLAAPPDPATPTLDLRSEIRPALLRVGERIAWLLVRLPASLDLVTLREQAAAELAAPGLGAERPRSIAEALARLSATQQANQQTDRHRHRHAEAVAQ